MATRKSSSTAIRNSLVKTKASQSAARPANSKEEALLTAVHEAIHECYTLYSIVNCALSRWIQAEDHEAQGSQPMTDVEYLFHDAQTRLKNLAEKLGDADYVPTGVSQ